jgi:enterochelin esterase-like enzyme
MLLRLRKTLSFRLYISSLSNSIVSSYLQMLMMLPYESNETLINLVFIIILDGLSWLRSEKLEVVFERLDILQIRSINIGETR